MTKRLAIGACLIVGLSIGTWADQGPPPLNRIMKAKLAHSQAILGAVVTSNWTLLDRESRALAIAVRDPAWGAALTEPEYLRQSDAFSRALQDLIEASAKREPRIGRERANRVDRKLRALPFAHDTAPHREIGIVHGAPGRNRHAMDLRRHRAGFLAGAAYRDFPP